MINQSFTPALVKGLEYVTQSLDWLFPKHCFGCEKIHQPEKISNLCIFCWEKMFHPMRIAFPNRPDLHIISAGVYEDLLKKCILKAKFKHHFISTDILTVMAKQTLSRIPYSFDIITSVPSDYWRTLCRGVDLPGTIAKDLSKHLGVDFRTNVLKKRRPSKQQSKLTQKERSENVRWLYLASRDVRGQNILVIDDILTTGSTVLACFKALQRQNPSHIVFLTLAKTPY